MIQETFLFLFFVFLLIFGANLVLKRTGNYDIDFIMKIAGWIILAPAIWGLLESLRLL